MEKHRCYFPRRVWVFIIVSLALSAWLHVTSPPLDNIMVPALWVLAGLTALGWFLRHGDGRWCAAGAGATLREQPFADTGESSAAFHHAASSDVSAKQRRRLAPRSQREHQPFRNSISD